ncbi:outer membrane beta-barrel protein [Desulfobotulus sp.]|jgi:opacity protein-like surface antigen|uniref:outer membrane beta-barrel protein n=1 Tax=Desulfobotulus sp. TaxID=1940337 RepID=UPI002A35B1B4|nr:outer membrane beta-barrel protein [Desulfobotulus sp.]MDY0161680.1 outer membrane beta-barrel protein [Desulfobotulus sp.]
MKKTVRILVIAAACLCMAFPALAAERFNGNVNLLVGSKIMDNDWDPADEQVGFGLMLDMAGNHWPVHLVADILVASGDARGVYQAYSPNPMKMEVDTEELHLGIRKYLAVSEAITPYAGLGLAAIRANMSLEDNGLRFSDDDVAYGWWGGLGVKFKAVDDLSLGVDLRYSKAEATLAGRDMEIGGFRAGIFMGLGW